MVKGCVVWMTGLPGSGKSTLADGLSNALRGHDRSVEVLDGDAVRTWLTAGLGFSKSDRDENVRRIAQVAKLLARNGVIVLVAVVSPYREVRSEIRTDINDFVEIYVKCRIDVLKERDTKGMYAKALRGEIKNFTGVSDPYEEPLDPHLVIETDLEREEESIGSIISKLSDLGYIESA